MTIIDTRPPLSLDETGGFTMLIDLLHKKPAVTGEYPIVTEPDDEKDSDAPFSTPQPAPIAQPVQRSVDGFLRRTLGRVKAAIAKAVATVREACGWLFSDLPDLNHAGEKFGAWRRRMNYKGRRNVKRAWFGRQLSTAQAVRTTRSRRAAAQQISRTKEGVLSSYYELPEYWVSHMTSFIEVIRGHDDALRGRGEHFVCQ